MVYCKKFPDCKLQYLTTIALIVLCTLTIICNPSLDENTPGVKKEWHIKKFLLKKMKSNGQPKPLL